jgi:hypothetical protein
MGGPIDGTSRPSVVADGQKADRSGARSPDAHATAVAKMTAPAPAGRRCAPAPSDRWRSVRRRGFDQSVRVAELSAVDGLRYDSCRLQAELGARESTRAGDRLDHHQLDSFDPLELRLSLAAVRHLGVSCPVRQSGSSRFSELTVPFGVLQRIARTDLFVGQPPQWIDGVQRKKLLRGSL